MFDIMAFFRKHKRTITILVAIIVPLVVFIAASNTASAFGDYNDYDYDYDYGGSSDWGDYDGGSGDSGIIDLVFFLFGIVYDLFGLPGVCCLATILIIIVGVVTIVSTAKEKRRKKYSSDKYKGTATDTQMNDMKFTNNSNVTKRPKAPDAPKPNRTTEIVKIISANDELFTEPDFITYAKQVYTDIQYAWCARDLSPVQAILHSNLYERTQAQLDMKKRDKVVPHLERLTVENAYMTAYRRDKEYEYAVVYLSSKMIDYQTNEDTGEVLYGDRTTRWEMHYLMTFMRSVKVKTPKMGAASRAFNCPNCGGTMNGSTTFGVCPYCGSSVKSGEYGWVLSDFSQAKNNTPDMGIVVEDEQNQ